jgi:hypothetical protein
VRVFPFDFAVIRLFGRGVGFVFPVGSALVRGGICGIGFAKDRGGVPGLNPVLPGAHPCFLIVDSLNYDRMARTQINNYSTEMHSAALDAGQRIGDTGRFPSPCPQESPIHHPVGEQSVKDETAGSSGVVEGLAGMAMKTDDILHAELQSVPEVLACRAGRKNGVELGQKFALFLERCVKGRRIVGLVRSPIDILGRGVNGLYSLRACSLRASYSFCFLAQYSASAASSFFSPRPRQERPPRVRMRQRQPLRLSKSCDDCPECRSLIP